MDATILVLKNAVTAAKLVTGEIAKNGQNHVNSHYEQLMQLRGVSYAICEDMFLRRLRNEVEARNLEHETVEHVVEAARVIEQLVSHLRGPSLLQRIMFWKKADARPDALAFRDALRGAATALKSAQEISSRYREDKRDFVIRSEDRQSRAKEVEDSTAKARESLSILSVKAGHLLEFLNAYFKNRV